MKTEMDLNALAGRLSAQDALIGQLQAIVVAAGLISHSDLAQMIADHGKAAQRDGNPHLAMIMTARAAAVRAAALR